MNTNTKPAPKDGDILLKNLRLMAYIGRTRLYEQDETAMTQLGEWVYICRN